MVSGRRQGLGERTEREDKERRGHKDNWHLNYLPEFMSLASELEIDF